MPLLLVKTVSSEFSIRWIAGEHMKDTDHDGVRDVEDCLCHPQ